MTRPRGKIDVVCQNPGCHYYRKDAGKCIIKSVKYKCTSYHRELYIDVTANKAGIGGIV